MLSIDLRQLFVLVCHCINNLTISYKYHSGHTSRNNSQLFFSFAPTGIWTGTISPINDPVVRTCSNFPQIKNITTTWNVHYHQQNYIQISLRNGNIMFLQLFLVNVDQWLIILNKIDWEENQNQLSKKITYNTERN